MRRGFEENGFASALVAWCGGGGRGRAPSNCHRLSVFAVNLLEGGRIQLERLASDWKLLLRIASLESSKKLRDTCFFAAGRPDQGRPQCSARR